jgi:hypothetical protein
MLWQRIRDEAFHRAWDEYWQEQTLDGCLLSCLKIPDLGHQEGMLED